MAGGVALNCVANEKYNRNRFLQCGFSQLVAMQGDFGVAMSIFYDHLKTERFVRKIMILWKDASW